MSPAVRHWMTMVDAGFFAIAAVGLWRWRSTIRHTTLMTAWPWAWAAWTAAVMSWTLRFQNAALVTYADYFTAVAVLSPPMASLGARRPTCRSWPFFVLLPMFAVLLWPAISVGLATRFARPLVLETPAMAMYVVVLIMALGNYALGRLGFLTVLLMSVLAGQVSTLGLRLTGLPGEVFRSAAIWIVVVLIFGMREVVNLKSHGVYDDSEVPEALQNPFNAILFEFGELYGLVWSLRIQDRLNVFAAQNQWPVRFEGRQLYYTGTLNDEHRAEIERAFRWLFRRFVDPTWLDARLHHPGTPVADSFPSSIDS